MTMKEELIEKIKNRTLTMGVCGLGYVGLPLAVDKAKHGFHTIGFDVQQEKVDMVNAGKNYIGDVVNSDLEELVSSGMLSATTDFSRVCDVDFIAICVPTPLDKHQQPDISYVRDSTIAIAKHLTRGSIVVLESTTYPGTTEELLKPLLEEGSGLKCGTDFYLGFSPERIDPGNLIYKTSNTPKVVGAIGADAVEVIAMVYRSILEGDVTTVSSPAVAEMEKILENTYRNINIGLVNELAILCNKMNIDIWEVIDAAKTKPYGFQAFYPVERAGKILNRHKKALNGAKVLMLGMAYKQDIDDYRESPAIRVMEEFHKTGAQTDFYDPFIPKLRHNGQWYTGVETLNAEVVKGYDLVIITTAHSNVDYQMVANCGVPVFDCKNVMKNISNRENIEVL